MLLLGNVFLVTFRNHVCLCIPKRGHITVGYSRRFPVDMAWIPVRRLPLLAMMLPPTLPCRTQSLRIRFDVYGWLGLQILLHFSSSKDHPDDRGKENGRASMRCKNVRWWCFVVVLGPLARIQLLPLVTAGHKLNEEKGCSTSRRQIVVAGRPYI